MFNLLKRREDLPRSLNAVELTTYIVDTRTFVYVSYYAGHILSDTYTSIRPSRSTIPLDHHRHLSVQTPRISTRPIELPSLLRFPFLSSISDARKSPLLPQSSLLPSFLLSVPSDSPHLGASTPFDSIVSARTRSLSWVGVVERLGVFW